MRNAVAELFRALANELRVEVFNEGQRGVGESAGYREGWNDATRAHVRRVEAAAAKVEAM